MNNFFDVIKVNFVEETEKYFNSVKVESVKTDREHNTLNFYLVSYDLIPYRNIKDARIELAKQLFDIDSNKIDINDEKFPVNIKMRYVLNDLFNPKYIFENYQDCIENELKLKGKSVFGMYSMSKFVFSNDNKLSVTFDNCEMYKMWQDEIIDYLVRLYKDSFNIDLDFEIIYENKPMKKFDGVEPPKFYANEEDRILDRLKDKVESGEIRKDVIADDNNKKSEDIKEIIVSHNKKKKESGFVEDGNELYGKKQKGKFVPCVISSLENERDNIIINGIIYFYSTHDTKNGRTIFSILVYDGTSCISVKLWGNPEDKSLFKLRFNIGDEISIYGKAINDIYERAMIIKPQYILKTGHRDVVEFGKVDSEDYYNVILTNRIDEEPEKRVELHLHTKSSAHDGVGEVKAYIDTARKFGMKAMAITDHGCVNALPDAYEYVKSLKDKLKKKDPTKKLDFKIINGMEGYLVEDFESYYFDENEKESIYNYKFNSSYVVFAFETTGFNIRNDAIIKIVASKIDGYKIVDKFSTFVKCNKPLSFEIKDKTHIKDADLINAVDIKEALKMFLEFSKDSVFVTLNKNATWKLQDVLKINGFNVKLNILDITILSRLYLDDIAINDSMSISKKLFGIAASKSLSVKVLGITDKKKEEKNAGLLSDDLVTLASEITITILQKIENDKKISDLLSLKNIVKFDENFFARQKYYHIVLLAKNDVGRINLYKLVSDSCIKYFYRKPRIPRSLLNRYREGLIIGSACIAGEFMNAIKNGCNDDKLCDIASYYDYLEVQPIKNNSFLLKEDAENFRNDTDLENLNKKVIFIADKLKKPVVATCDCHYVEKSDKVYRQMLIVGERSKKTNQDATGNIKAEVLEDSESSNDEELYFRTTKEMLDEFNYLGVDKAYEIVVKNTNLINDMIEDVLPVRLDKCPPHIKGSDEDLIKTCNETLTKIYGNNPPKEIKDRLDNELKYIIDNGYSVMYITAKKLIDYSKEHGFPVGSRGSVGSSLAATFSGVSEVNPLPPHYICPKCQHVEYDTEETRKYFNDSGFDMPDKKCPECGTLMNKEGMNIPFETFLGIPGDSKAQKEPDIDLNFCSVFQSSIHKHTVDIFGEKNTFKAGTVGTVAMKTAYSYVSKFAENIGINLSFLQKNFYRDKIVNCKNTSGQHPGGMVVVPDNESIYTFTPIQRPADKEGSGITTHFDYHKIDKNLLKLDILGHDSPLMLKKLFEYTGVDYNTVPFYEDEVIKLFESPNSLGITSADISGTHLGCLTIPEFGTDFAMAMCEEAKPKTVADLIRIAGLAHGTDVWQNNVQELIKNGDCTLKNAICCRDDIMIYLIEKGIDKGMSFNIMESVRKGKSLNATWEDEMRKHEVPEWYIGCCKKIKYMFPKAHAAAYVLASLRIAYYKVHYPKEYYAAYFSIKKDGFDYGLMLQSREDINIQIAKIKKIMNDKSSKDANFKKDLQNKEKPMDILEKAYNKIVNINIKNEDDNNIVDVNNEEKVDEKQEKYESMSANNLFDLYMCYRIVEEMKARGIDFCPIDIYNAKRSDFIPIKNSNLIMPSFDSIPGVGTKDISIDYNDEIAIDKKSTAMRCEIEGRKEEYTSIENFRQRTKVSKTIIEYMRKNGLFGTLDDKEALPIFELLRKQ